MEEPKIVLNQSTFKALAAGTRVKILKTLEQRRHTQSELSAVLNISVPTVKEHLSDLVKAGLVNRHEEGRKWIYYSLTEKAKCILDPERKRLWIVLGFFLASVAGTIITVRNYFAGQIGVLAGAPEARVFAAKEAAIAAEEGIVATAAESAPQPMLDAAQVAPEAVNQISPVYSYLMIGFIVLTIMLFILGIYFLSKSRVLRKK
ncbi:MAG: winged helix-turn-helix domain-containing protein [Candidatus Woesearchaeota archaeon]